VQSYYFQSFDEQLSFSGAEAACIAKGGYLASVKDSDEMAMLKDPTKLDLTLPIIGEE